MRKALSKRKSEIPCIYYLHRIYTLNILKAHICLNFNHWRPNMYCPWRKLQDQKIQYQSHKQHNWIRKLIKQTTLEKLKKINKMTNFLNYLLLKWINVVAIIVTARNLSNLKKNSTRQQGTSHVIPSMTNKITVPRILN